MSSMLLFISKADRLNELIRRVDVQSGAVSVLAGAVSTAGNADGIGSSAAFNAPVSVALDAAGTIVIVVS